MSRKAWRLLFVLSLGLLAGCAKVPAVAWRIVDPGGQPIAGAEVFAQPMADRGPWGSLQTWRQWPRDELVRLGATDGDGRVTLSAFPAERCEVAVRAPGHGPRVFPNDLLPGTYRVFLEASGGPLESEPFVVTGGAETAVEIAVDPARLRKGGRQGAGAIAPPPR